MKIYLYNFIFAFVLICFVTAEDNERTNENKVAEKEQNKAKSKFNKKIDLSKIEKAWENGDDEEELVNDIGFDNKRASERVEKKKKKGKEKMVPDDVMNEYKKNPDAFIKKMKNKNKGAIILLDFS